MIAFGVVFGLIVYVIEELSLVICDCLVIVAVLFMVIFLCWAPGIFVKIIICVVVGFSGTVLTEKD